MTTSSGTAIEADEEQLDRVFRALGCSTRRAMLRRLGAGSATVSELAEPFAISLAGASKHLRVLEDAGLARRSVDGRVRRCQLIAEPLRDASAWITMYQPFWESTLDALAGYVGASDDTNK